MKSEIDLLASIRSNRKLIWACLAVFIIVLVAGFFYVRSLPVKTENTSSSEFRVINGEKSLWLYLGTYHRITTLADVVSVIRSPEVLEKVSETYDIDMSIADLRQNIDLYDLGDMNFRLELIYPDRDLGEKINLSLIYTYLEVIESRMDNDNKDLFDVGVTMQPVSRETSPGTVYKLFAAFLFGLFCVIIIILITRLVRSILKKRHEKE